MKRRLLDKFTGTSINLEVDTKTASTLPNQDSFNVITWYPVPTQKVSIPCFDYMISYLDDKTMKINLYDHVRGYGIKEGMHLYVDVSTIHREGIVKSIDGKTVTLKIVWRNDYERN